MMGKSTKTKLAGSLAASLSILLGACGGVPTENRSLYSVRQPVIERSTYTLDVATDYDGVPMSEQQRLEAWFESIDLKFGDRVSIEDASANPGVRADIAKLAGREGLLLAEGAPVTSGVIGAGQARIVVTRSTASVPGCPAWTANNELNEDNATYPDYGCATNSNLAAMVANPEDLIHGQKGTGETTVVTSTKAIEAYRQAPTTGSKGLPTSSTAEGGN